MSIPAAENEKFSGKVKKEIKQTTPPRAGFLEQKTN
jgi:hypothetical protein